MTRPSAAGTFRCQQAAAHANNGRAVMHTSHRCLAMVALMLGCGLREHDHRTSRAATRNDSGAGGSDAAPAAPGPGVTIEGQFVPRARAVVFLHIGHSNMAG